MMPGPWELILILIIVLVVFGGKRIPEIMGGMGKGIRSFKKAMDTDEDSPQQTGQNQQSSIQESEAAKADTSKPTLQDASAPTKLEPK